MSLNKQMILFIASMLLILLLGTFGLNLSNTKHFLQEQLSSHAQDTATSLGLSLSTVSDPTDLSSMETMINAVFDRGYYSTIILNDVENQVLYQRSNTKEMEAVPTWFINFIQLNAPSAEAVVQSGWMPIGTLSVQSHAGYAYAELWRTATNLLLWFILAAILAILIVVYTLKLLLKPLKEMEKQAEAIVKKEYLIQGNLPTTVEFRRVVSAMNAMVHKLKTVFERDADTAEKLQKMAYQDSVTGLSNRRHFEMIFDTLLEPGEEAVEGTLCLLRIHELKEFNEQFGYLVGDQLMKSLADALQHNLSQSNNVFARLNGTELIAILPGVKPSQMGTATQLLANQMALILQNLAAEHAPASLSIGYTHYQPAQSRGALLASLDFAVEQAKNAGTNQVFYYDPAPSAPSTHATWEATLNQAIEEERFILFQQSACASPDQVHNQEILIRLKDPEGTIRSAGYFMPAVEQLNKMAEIDQMVFTQIKRYLEQHSATPLLAINLSKSIFEQAQFKETLLQTLRQMGDSRKRVAFEMPESLIAAHQTVSWPLIKEFKELGITIGLDHFGCRLGNMRYLQDLHPDYIKLDAAFSKAIESDEQTQNYVSSLCELADSLDIKVIAMAVETESQRQAFAALGVDYFQGYLFGAPTTLK